MQVAVLEWICGGGLLDALPEHVPATLRAEGWAMLSTLVEGLHAGGIGVAVALDPRLVSRPNLERLASQASIQTASSLAGDDLECTWNRVSEACDLTLVIAPEFDNVLLHVTESLRSQGIQLVNCSADFLSIAGDKLATARALHAHSIKHPPTRRLTDIDQEWLRTVRASAATDGEAALWVVKPSDGAGGSGQQLCDEHALLRLQSQGAGQARGRGQSRKLLVQPWLPGVPYSCSAIVDIEGKRHWLPVVSQDFATTADDRPQPPAYIGCSLACPADRLATPIALLDAALAALGDGACGWISVDLLYSVDQQSWCVIEVNPRCTTSMVGLAQAYEGNLVMEMLHAFEHPLEGLAGAWNATTLRI